MVILSSDIKKVWTKSNHPMKLYVTQMKTFKTKDIEMGSEIVVTECYITDWLAVGQGANKAIKINRFY